MIRYADLAACGLAAKPSLITFALPIVCRAESEGFDRKKLLDAVRSMCISGLVNERCPAELAERLEPLAQAIRAAGIVGGEWKPREAPAPWRLWSKGMEGADGEPVLAAALEAAGGNWMPAPANDGIDGGSMMQMHRAASLPVTTGGALMPDAHTGYGLPIGGVLAVRNAVIPYAVGVDIACRMRLTVLDIPLEEFEAHQERFVEAIELETRFGVGAKFERHELRSHAVLDADWSFCTPLKANRDRAVLQLGTSGGGNHFVEFGMLTLDKPCREPGFTLEAGRWLALLSHSGSRGTGEAVAEHYSTLAMSMRPQLPAELRHLAWLDMDSEAGAEYWQAMQLMGRYASANHELIHEHILKRLGAQAVAMVENHHNFAWRETYDLGDGPEELIIHRKGATPAAEGVLGVVPGSMATPGFVVRGKGCEASFRSCSHGAGRRLSRKAAFQNLDREAMHTLLESRGVRLLSGSLDESPEAYKDILPVIAAQNDLIDVLARFDPRLVKMAPEGKAPAWWKK